TAYGTGTAQPDAVLRILWSGRIRARLQLLQGECLRPGQYLDADGVLETQGMQPPAVQHVLHGTDDGSRSRRAHRVDFGKDCGGLRAFGARPYREIKTMTDMKAVY